MKHKKHFPTSLLITWKNSCDILCLIISITLFISFIPGLFLLYLYRLVVWIAVRLYRPDLDAFIVGPNAFLAPESTEKIFSIIMMGLVLKGNLSSEKLRSLFQERVLNLRDSQGQLIYKRLLQSWTFFMGYAFWKNDQENFKLQNHIRDYDYRGELHLPNCAEENDLQGIWAKLAETAWKEGQSPWELLVIRNYKKWNERGPHTLLIFRVDHIHCDFYSIIGLFRVLFESPFTTPKPSRNYMKVRIWDYIMAILMLPRALNIYLAMMIRGRRLRGGNFSGNDLHYSTTTNVPLEMIKSVKKKYQVEFASVVHSAIHGSIARVMRESGQIPPSNLDLMYVLPLPDHPGGWCNHACVIATELPCETRSRKERLMETNRILRTYDNSLLPIYQMYFVELISRIPTKLLQASNSFSMKFGPSFVMSNCPVTLNRDYVEGMEIVDAFSTFAADKKIGMTITSWGVNSRQRFNFLLDKSIFHDEIAAEKIATYFEEELEDLNKY